jgi:hypothetical protein
MKPRRKKSTFGQRLLESAQEAARVERGEVEPARVTRYTVAEAEVEPRLNTELIGFAKSAITWSSRSRSSQQRSM